MPTDPRPQRPDESGGLRVRHEAGLLARAVFDVAKALPRGNRGDLGDQLRRSASSVYANLAEGEGRATTADRLRCFTIAWGSLREIEAHLDLAEYTGAAPAQLGHARSHARHVGRMLFALRRKLSAAPPPSRPPSSQPRRSNSAPPTAPVQQRPTTPALPVVPTPTSTQALSVLPTPLTFDLLSGAFAVCRLAADAPVPAWALAAPFSVVARTADELSVVCDEARVPAAVRAERGWRVLKLRGPFAFDEVGVLLRAAAPLAAAGVSIMPVATFDTDYVLVPGSRLADALAALRAAGHAVAESPADPHV